LKAKSLRTVAASSSTGSAEELGELIERARRDIAEAEKKRQHHAADIERTNNLIAEIEQRLNQSQGELTQVINQTGQIQKNRTERGTRFQELHLAASKSETKVSALEEELSGTKVRRDSTREQIEQLAKEIQRSGEAREKLVSQIAASLKTSKRKIIDVEAALREKQKLVSELEHELAVLERTLAEKRSRLEVLRQLNDEGEGLAEGSQAVLRGVVEAEKFRGAIAGSLVAHLDVDSQFIPAIEAALGRNLHAVVLKDANIAFEIIAQLKEKKLGQAALLLPKLPEPTPDASQKTLPQRALAWATDKLVAPRMLEPVIRQLLGNVAVFSDLEQALQCKKHEPVLAIATLAGEFISAEGIIFAGSSEMRASSLLERKAQIAELVKDGALLAKQRDSLCSRRDEAKAGLESASRLQRDFADSDRRIDNLRSEKNALERQVAAADERLAQLERELQTMRDQLAKEKAELAAFEAAQKENVVREEELTDKINQLRLTLATERQRCEQGARRAEAEANVLKIAEQRASRLGVISDREGELRRLRDSIGDLQHRRAQSQVRESQVQMNIDNLAEHISRSYHVDLRQFVVDQGEFDKTLRAQVKRKENAEGEASFEGLRTGSATPGSPELAPPDIEKIVDELRRQLDNMGPVNLDAVHEYDELEERYKFLEAQNNDLTNSRRELLDVIAQINSTTRKLFAETFDQVRANFREMFAELFGGGRADLSLMDENDPLNCGIEITAKPPGKQLQTISLLSGGERSMVAVALLFAIYMVRPSPFCILDEVDAAMDEGNINRFISVLERFVEQSQFIIITHNKRTIAKADVLYGVTMQERGVSKLVGMKLTAPAQVPAELRSNGGQEKPAQSRLALAMR